MAPWANNFLQKLIDYVHTEKTRKQIQEMIIDPLLNHVMNRVFPYIILTCVLFVLLLIVILVTLGIIIIQIRSGGTVGSRLTQVNPIQLPV
jgi:uncharacterized membrane protein